MIGNPFPLKQNAGKSFQGSIVLGKGFVVTQEEAAALIAKDHRNKDVLYPYLNGDDLNNDPYQKPSRWVINFFDWSEEKARTYPHCFEIIERLVRPERQRWKTDENGKEIEGTYALRKPLPQKWWMYGEKRPALYETISKLDQVMVMTRVSKYVVVAMLPVAQVFMEKIVVKTFQDFMFFSILQSSIFIEWAWKYSSTLGSGTINYSPSTCFDTFPFPGDRDKTHLDQIGMKFYSSRSALMKKSQLGLTKIYNQFHNKDLQSVDTIDNLSFVDEYGKESSYLMKHLQDVTSTSFNEVVNGIQNLRDLQIEMDKMVLRAYGWQDIVLRHAFYEMEYLPETDRTRFTIHPDARKEVLKRLLILNHRVYGIQTPPATDKKSKYKNYTKPSNSSDSPTLF